MLYGYQGKILWIDLSEKTVNKVDLSADDAYKYIGGSGLGAKILFSTTGAETDPLGPENTLIFM
ncbi:MAG: Aldehyde ferredoxin oxidoreductase, partial [Peptococcaceae bacterium]|nr:Aldehyde ferredoxin oxidoreductase [Peptococcaceae bacterium]